jgi:RNA polymerase sigma-54 factor
MKQTLQLKLTQHLTLTPQLQQSIRLLQLSTLELNAEVDRMLQENPLLEREEGEEDATPQEFPLAGTAPGPVTSERPRATTCPTSPTSPTTAAAAPTATGAAAAAAARTRTSRRSRSLRARCATT